MVVESVKYRVRVKQYGVVEVVFRLNPAKGGRTLVTVCGDNGPECYTWGQPRDVPRTKTYFTPTQTAARHFAEAFLRKFKEKRA